METQFDRRDLLKLAGLGASALVLSGQTSEAVSYATITVDPTPRQRFEGFGVSEASNTNTVLAALPDATVQSALDFIDTNMPIHMRHVWISGPFEWTIDQMLASFRASYVTRKVIRQNLISGDRQLLLIPSQNHVAPTIPLADYAAKVAQTIARLASEDGVTIDFTSISNEPNLWSNQNMVDGIIAMRAALDASGLQHVGVVGPDAASVNPATISMVQAIQANPTAWAGLAAIATHSYNMCTTPALASARSGKPLWVTEAGNSVEAVNTGQSPALLPWMEAVTDAGRFLSDMNNSVTRWLWFVGLTASAQPQSQQAGLVVLTPSGNMVVFPRMQYIKLLAKTFPKGSIFRRCSSDMDGQMVWTYGRKPCVTVAFAIANDGTARLGLVNATGVANDSLETFASPSRVYCTLNLPVRNTSFRMKVTSSDGTTIDQGVVKVDSSGMCQVTLEPLSLHTAIEI